MRWWPLMLVAAVAWADTPTPQRMPALFVDGRRRTGGGPVVVIPPTTKLRVQPNTNAGDRAALAHRAATATGLARIAALDELAAALENFDLDDDNLEAALQFVTGLYVQILAIPELDRYRYVDELLARGARNVAATNSDLAQKAAERLVAKYAKSPFVLDAHFVLATIFEDRKKFTEAKQHLEAAIAINRSDDVVMFARLRLGWLYIRAGDHGSALRELRAIAADPKATHVREAAVDSLISSYVQVARPDGAVQLFDAVDRSRTNEWLRELAGQYHEAGKLDHEAAVLRVVLARDNDKIATCIDRVDLVRALANAPNPTDAELAVGELVAAVPFATSACAPLADDAVGELAWHWHTRAKTEHQKAAAARMWDRASELATTKDRKATALANRALLKR